MKRLVIAFAAAVVIAATASAKITFSQGFEADMAGFVSSDGDEDASAPATYADEGVSKADNARAPYPFAGADADESFGDSFLMLDTGDATLWRTNTVEGNIYFDMVMQFNPCATAPELDDDTKIAVYLNSSSNLVILAGDVNGGTSTNVTERSLNPGEWGRLSILAEAGNAGLVFKVYLNGVDNSDSGLVGTYNSRTADMTVKSVGFKGSGALDDFVARTTNPFIQNPAATIADGNEGYASLEDALADVDANTVITLGADHAAQIPGLASGTTYKIANTNNFAFGGFKGANEVAVRTSGPDANDVTTYTGVDGVAAINVLVDGLNDNTPNYVWYETFAEAYDEAYKTFMGQEGRTAKWSDLKVKVGSDFAPESSAVSMKFRNLTFEATTEDPIAISLGGKFYAINSYEFPTTATLTLWHNQPFSTTGAASYQTEVAAISGGTLDIPENVTLTLNSYMAFANLTGLTGRGTIKPTSDARLYLLYYSNETLPGFLRNANWQGTLELTGTHTYNWKLGDFGNAGSAIKFNGLTTYLLAVTQSVGTVELVGDGLTINGNANTGSWTFDAALKGSGALNVDIAPSQLGNGTKLVQFIGDTSAFSGSVTFGENAGNDYIVFGSGDKTVTTPKAIEVLSGASVSVGAGATWTASDLTVGGTLGIAGTLTATNNAIFNGGAAVNVTGAMVTSSATPTINNGGSVTIAEGATWTIPTGGANVHGNLTVGGSVVGADENVGKIYSTAGTACVTLTNPNGCKTGGIYWRGKFILAWDTEDDTVAFDIANYGGKIDTVGAATIQIDGVNGAFSGYITNAANVTVNASVILNADWTVGGGNASYTTTFTSLSGSGDLIVNGASDDTTPIPYAITKLDGYTGTLGGDRGSFTIGTVNVAEAPAAGAVVVKTGIGEHGEVSGYPALTVAGGAVSGHLVYDASAATPGYYVATVQSGADYYLSIADAFDDGKTTATMLADSDEDVVLKADCSLVTGGHQCGKISTNVEGYEIEFKNGTYTAVSVKAAKIGDVEYATLSDAVDAAGASDTILLLKNVDVDLALNKEVKLDVGSYAYTGTLSGAGTLTLVKDAELTFGNWTGTVVIGWDASGKVMPDKYGKAGSTVAYACAISSGYFSKKDETAAPSIAPALYFAENVTIDNGFSNTTTTFARVSMALGKTFKTRGSGSNHTHYDFKELKGFEGTIDVRGYDHVTISNIVLAAAPTASDCLVKITKSANATVPGTSGAASINVKVGDAAAVAMPLVFATKNDVSGLYLEEYAVKFYADNEMSEQIGVTQYVAYGAKAAAPAAPEKSGFTFTGWSPDTNSVITAAQNFIAQWNEDSSDPIPDLPANPTAQDITNKIDEIFADAAAIKEIVAGDPEKYAAIKTWANTVPGGQEAVAKSAHAAASYQLSSIVETPKLFTNEPALEITDIAPASSSTSWEVTVELKDGETTVPLAAVEAFASRVYRSNSLSDIDLPASQCTTSDVEVSTATGGKVKLSVAPPAAGNAGFIKIKCD